MAVEYLRSAGSRARSQALANAYEADINMVTTFADAKIIRVESSGGASSGDGHPRQLWLGFYADVHYVSVCAEEGCA